MSAKSNATAIIYQLKITLDGSKPPIWRRIQVKGDISLYKLHYVLQILMGWQNSHMHQYIINDEYYGEPHPDLGFEVRNEQKFKLQQLVGEKDKFFYEYDFGDSWLHKIEVEKVIAPEPGMKYPVCLTGKRNGPLEDVGGIWGYEEFLKAMKDKKHPDHEDMRNWLEEAYELEDYDPNEFDLDEINEELKKLK